MITQAELLSLALKLKEMGQQVEVNPEELEAYFPDVDKSMYLPTDIPKNFYFDAEALRQAGQLGDMKPLTRVNFSLLRRLGRL